MTHTHKLTSAIVGVAALALLLAAAVPAEAVNCSSVCNQVRRSCIHSAKGVYQAGKIQCDEDLDGCKTDCAANAATCIPDCLGDPECELDCVNCEDNCDAARDQCRTDNKAARDLLRDGCDGLRGDCGDICVDPLDKQDVRDCTTAEHGCRADAKRTEVACKQGCPKDGGRKACIRSCRKTNNLDQQACQDVATMCYAAVAGLVLAP